MLMRISLQQDDSAADVRGYEFTAPLTDWHRLATAEWPAVKGACIVRRLHRSGLVCHGALVQRRNGSWAFSYDLGDDDDEVLNHLEKDVFAIGNETKVTGADGITRRFRVIDLGPFIERL